ncbi:MAG: glycosyltransferase [Spirochaetes bacterium]|jgi:glycosyltransferase involved in cell wall biosynthesis|nr:glycosyltransferase [Spirochaetota bacterium]
MHSEKKLNIAMVIDVYDDTKNGGAISLKRFADHIGKNHNITIVSTGDAREGKVSVPNFYLPLVKNIMVRMKFTFGRPNDKILTETFKNKDLVHVQFPFFLGYKSIMLAKKAGIPVVSGFHVQPENILYNIGIRSKFIVKFLYKMFVKYIYNNTDAVICPSRFAENKLKKYGLKSPSFVVSNGIPHHFSPINTRRDPEYDDKFVILTVGRMAKDKRHDVLIKAILKSKHRKSIQLIATGDGPRKNALIQMGKSLPNKPVFDFVPFDELIRLYNTADLYVHPSEVELESMSVLEAIGCGLPALISDAPASAAGQFAINRKFLFRHNDVKDLAEKIDYWIDNKNNLAIYREKYLALSREFKFENSLRKMEEMYLEYSGKRNTNL